jgi:hypothetical protein
MMSGRFLPCRSTISADEIVVDASVASTLLLGLGNVDIDQLTTTAAVKAVPTNQMLCSSYHLAS